MKENTEENLLSITFDQLLSFKHVKALYKKPRHKVHAFARISRYIDTEKLQQFNERVHLVTL